MKATNDEPTSGLVARLVNAVAAGLSRRAALQAAEYIPFCIRLNRYSRYHTRIGF